MKSSDLEIIKKIVDRAYLPHVNGYARVELTLDLCAVHERTPLRLQDLLEADEFNFKHDIAGIQKYLDRETSRLTHDFRPRFLRRKVKRKRSTGVGVA